MTSPSLSPETFEVLTSIGFISQDETTLLHPDGGAISKRAFDELETMAGRTSNIRYMARAMDHYDGVASPAEGTPQGDRQFEHLLSRLPKTAMIYFALRRLQRKGDLAGLRNGLGLLLAFEKELITGDDILSALWPEGQANAAEKLLLPSRAIAIEA